MALILAIEPDPLQAAQLMSLIQSRVGAELVLAETTEQALGAIGDRVPDLVLVPALLAPQEDATLATALRVIAAAAHVRMLTIPVLAATSGARRPLGLLARWRRLPPDPPAPEGCDPSVFGDQIAAYLAEATAERAINESDLKLALAAAKGSGHASVQTEPAEELAVDVSPIAAAETLSSPEALSPEALSAEALSAEAAAPAISGPDLEATLVALTITDTTDAKEQGPDLYVDRVLDGEEAIFAYAADTELPTEPVELTLDEMPIAAAETFLLAEATAEEAVIEDVDLAVEICLVASDEDMAARPDVSRPHAVSQAPWFGPQRRWPDLEGVEALDRFSVSTGEDTADAEVDAEFFQPAAPLSIDDMPAILNPTAASAAVVIEQTSIEVLEELPAIDLAPFGEPAPAATLELWMPLSFGSTRLWPALEGVWSEERLDPPLPTHADPALVSPPPAVSAPPPSTVAAEAPAPQQGAAARPEWIELIESLRQDVKRLRTERAQAPILAPRTKEMQGPASRLSPSLRPDAVADMDLKSKKHAKSAKPVQDEWGFFDPAQCGFAALLEKLDEITQVSDGA